MNQGGHYSTLHFSQTIVIDRRGCPSIFFFLLLSIAFLPEEFAHMSNQKQYGGAIRLLKPTHERALKAAEDCGQHLMTFVNEALEDVLRAYEAKASIRPRCIAKAEIHSIDPIVGEAEEQPKAKKKAKA